MTYVSIVFCSPGLENFWKGAGDLFPVKYLIKGQSQAYTKASSPLSHAELNVLSRPPTGVIFLPNCLY